VTAPGSAEHVIVHGLDAQFYALYWEATDQIQSAGINGIRPCGKADTVELAPVNPFRCSGQQKSDPIPWQPEKIAAEKCDFSRSLAATAETEEFSHRRKIDFRPRDHSRITSDQFLIAEDATVRAAGMWDKDRYDERSLVHGTVLDGRLINRGGATAGLPVVIAA